jgi:hypothetical protein
MDNEQGQWSLDNLMIAAPCDVDWDEMVGGDTVRKCSECRLNVYNIENLTSKEAQDLLNSDLAQSGRLCVQIYRRADGTLLTKDCPKGVAKIRAFSSRIWRSVAAALAAFLAGGSVLAQDKGQTAVSGAGTAAAEAAKSAPIGGRTIGLPPPQGFLKNKTDTGATKTGGQNQSAKQNSTETKTQSVTGETNHQSRAHHTAFNLYKEGEQLEKSGDFGKAVAVYQQALSIMAHQKHDPKFHLKIETALSRAKAKAGINQ